MLNLECADLTVLHDSKGSQSVFYAVGPQSDLASHAALLAEGVGRQISSRFKEYISAFSTEPAGRVSSRATGRSSATSCI